MTGPPAKPKHPLFLGDGLARALFDGLPMAAAVVAEDRRILAANLGAEHFLGAGSVEVVGAAPGEALRCVNSLRHPAGCGHAPECSDCLLRRAAEEALQGTEVRQRQVRVVVRGQEPRELILLLSASPLAWEGRRLALVLLQDVTALHQLRGLLPICAGCKKIRREDQAWEAIEAFIERHSLAEFTHGLCPECLERLYHGQSEER
ncbi:MAG: PAS domain-containing protein [Proteobacteria bacterium]|nr:PAS domain-containing protein [Pseudomonadota bacterium]